MSGADQAAIQSEATKISKQAYLACLFLLMADDERYGGMKAALNSNYLLGKQEFPRDLLAAKRLLADFKGSETKMMKRVTASEDNAGVALVEKEDKKGGYAPTC
jgi:hypothetical protein